MSDNEKYPGQLVFGLDIGTRSIVGTVGYMDKKKFHIVALYSKLHETRAMLDGQIHDISAVSESIKAVRAELEKKTGRQLKDVCIAAAGRVLQTVTTHVEQKFDEDTEINAEHVYSLELLGAQKAYEQFVKETVFDMKFYCVGYTVERYYLNKYPMSELENHKGDMIGADIIATFLPDEVVDGLYKAVDMAGLHVANLTLEPIAAMEVAIPQSYRMLNIALVDVGAGTSDISITRDEAITAYGMIPSAGDEITEVIAKHYLTDFAEAEKIKFGAGEKGSIEFTDIMGLTQKTSPEEVTELIKPTVFSMTREISDRIKYLNGGKPVSAVFVVGGGGKVPLFTENLAAEMGISPERVAVRGEEVLRNVDFEIDGVKKDSLLVTPVGICLNFYNQKNNFIFVTFNGVQIKLYDNSHLQVVDAAMQAGFANADLFPKHGKDISYTVNGKQKVVRGIVGEGAVIKLNGEQVSLNQKIKAGDNIEMIPSTAGAPAAVEISTLPEYRDSIKVIISGKTVTLPKFADVNGELKSGYYEIQDADAIVMRDYYTVQQLLDFLDVIVDNKEEIYVNHEQAFMDTPVYDNFTVSLSFAEQGRDSENSESSESSESMESASTDATDMPDESEVSEVSDVPEEPELTPAKKPEQVSQQTEGTTVTVLVNGKNVVLSGKKDYIYVDVFDRIDFDLSSPHGRAVATKLNGQAAQYVEKLHSGDVLDIYWEE